MRIVAASRASTVAIASAALLIPALLACTGKAPSETIDVRVAAASDLARAFEDVSKAFEAKSGKKVTLTFGSTGLLAKQIAEGAPFDLFAAANVSFVDDVVQAGKCDNDTKSLYARGRIVVWTRAGAAKVSGLADLADARFVKIALANPEHAPYGRAAREALQKAGLWDSLKPRLVFGENVRQALQFAQSGNADAAIVALSLATVAEGTHVLVPETEHAPLDQALVVCGAGPRAAAAKELATFVGSPDGRAIMNRYGFVLPGEPVR